tara:strand:- start:273 stop:641 length:369 start_codon:yes stop_codon:yes gene_type:complete
VKNRHYSPIYVAESLLKGTIDKIIDELGGSPDYSYNPDLNPPALSFTLRDITHTMFLKQEPSGEFILEEEITNNEGENLFYDTTTISPKRNRSGEISERFRDQFITNRIRNFKNAARNSNSE